ncbi:hypothetical protein [Nocardia sp. NPDC048505]|uniref:hypothetical protein n=1 Tax=unclassified Nocardia TaxID=2637762 RepID=UPI0034047C6D
MNLIQQRAFDQMIGELAVDLFDERATEAELLFQLADDSLQLGFGSDTQMQLECSAELYTAIVRVIGLHRRTGSGLLGATYHFEKNPDGSWDMGQHYQYGEPEPHFHAEPQRGWRHWLGFE